MRFHTAFYAMAMTALATLTSACGPEIVTVEKVVVVEKQIDRKVFVCSDKSVVDDPETCPPGPVTEKIVYECEGNKNTGPVRVDSPEECPVWTMTCPEGTTSYANHETDDQGCTYDATCHEGWAYEPSTKTCKKYCAVGETLSADGLTCEPVPALPAGTCLTDADCATPQRCNTENRCVATCHRDGDCGTDEWCGPPGIPSDVTQATCHSSLAPFVYVGHTEPNMYRATEAPYGAAHVAFSLTVITNLSVTLRSLAFSPRFASATHWDRNAAFVLQQFESCAIVGSPNGARWHVPTETMDDGIQDAVFNLDYPDAVTGRVELTVECVVTQGVAPIGPMTYRMALGAAGIDNADTGAALTRPTVVFGDTNDDATQVVRLYSATPCPGIRVTTASGSPAGASVPSFGEVLRFNVTVPASCNGIQPTTVQYRITDTGWYRGNEAAQVFDVMDTSQSVLPVVTQWHPDSFLIYTSDGSGDQDNTYISSGDTKTYSLRLDTTHASAVNDDGIRVDVSGFCYRDLVNGANVCLNQTSVLAYGGMIVF